MTRLITGSSASIINQYKQLSVEADRPVHPKTQLHIFDPTVLALVRVDQENKIVCSFGTFFPVFGGKVFL